MVAAKERKCDKNTGAKRSLSKFTLALIIAFMVTGLLLFLLPYAIQTATVSWLQQHGVEDARIDDIDLNLFSGKARIEGLKSGDGLNIDHLSIDFDWLPLWHHMVHIRTLKLSESNLRLLEKKGIWQVAGIAPEKRDVAASPAGTNKQEHSWIIVVDDLVLDAVNVNVKTGLFALSLPLKSLHLSLSPLQNQQQSMVNRIEIGDTTFSGFGYSIHVAGAKVAGAIDFSVLNKDILASLTSKQLSLSLRELEIHSEHDKRQINIAALKFDGIMLGAKHRIRVKSTGIEKIRIKYPLKGQGFINLAGAKISTMDVGFDGSIAIKKLGLKAFSAEGLAGNRQSLSIEKVALSGVSVAPSIKKADKKVAQRVRIKSLDMQNIGLKHAIDEHGNVTLKQLNLAALDIGTDGSIALAKLDLQHMKADALTQANYTLQLDGAKLAGLAIHPGEIVRLQILSLHKAKLFGSGRSATDSKQRLGGFENAKLEQFDMNGPDTGSFESFELEKVQLPSVGEFSLGSIGLIQASHAVLKKGGVYRVKQLNIDQLQAHLVKQKNGWLLPAGMGSNQSKRSAQDDQKPHAPVDKSDSGTPKAQLIIDNVLIGAGSQIELHDASVTPALVTTMQIERFHFAPLDSSGRQRGKLNVKMKLGKSGSLSLEGATNIAAGKQLDADIHLVLENFDLPRLSGYVEADLGKSIKTGQFNLDSEISIKNNSIDSKNKVLIRKLALEGLQHAHKSRPKINLAGGMSVDMALGMLQDDRGDVKLNVPVSGPLDNPDIKLTSGLVENRCPNLCSTGIATLWQHYSGCRCCQRPDQKCSETDIDPHRIYRTQRLSVTKNERIYQQDRHTDEEKGFPFTGLWYRYTY